MHQYAKSYLELFLTIEKEAMINTSKKLGLVMNSLIETKVTSCRE